MTQPAFMQIAVWTIAAFLIGSIPFGVVVGRLFFRSDIRSSGSGNIGAANALRSYGKLGGAAVLLLDGLKGFAPAYALLAFTPTDPAYAVWLGFVAVLGHCYSPWLGGRGGKGVATWLGAVTAISWPVALGFVLLWLAIVIPTRWASLGSLTATACSAIALGVVRHDPWTALVSGAAAAVIFVKHRENIGRLVAGRENKIGFGKASRA